MEIVFLIIICLLLLINLYISLNGRKDSSHQQIIELQHSVAKIEKGLKEDFRTNREENSIIARDNRTELNTTLKEFKTELTQTLATLTTQNQKSLENLNKTLEEKITALLEKSEIHQRQNREELVKSFQGFQETFEKNVKSFNDLQREKFAQLEIKQNELVKSTETRLDVIRSTVEEKLEKTLSDRLGQSFETVGKQLIEVQKGLGEMQILAQDVGGLKRVLSNVKMRGGIGEIQLGMLLEQILAPEQYQPNVKTKHGSNDVVEFAIKLPGRDDNNAQVWLPIDAKFPKDVYEQLQTAHDGGDLVQIDLAQKNLENTIKKMGRDICNKYIDPPGTTDFAIMFLPFEGIFAEVVRKASLLEDLQRNCKVIVTGPTTLAAILNSLQMGFKTLAIQKRSSEVWQVLGAVKKEFETFGGMLSKAQNNIKTGLNQLDDVMGKRTRAIQRKLSSVETLKEEKTNLIFPVNQELDPEEDA